MNKHRADTDLRQEMDDELLEFLNDDDLESKTLFGDYD